MIKDPLTQLPICKIENPKLPMKGYDLDKNSVDLQQLMVSGVKSPDFGFDSVLINPIEKEHIDVKEGLLKVA